MKKTTKIIILVIIAAVLLLGIGYAAISNITLNIGGTLEADPNQANFDVGFDLDVTPTVSNTDKVKASITDKLNAKFDVENLTTVGEEVTATYVVENASADLSADLAVATTNSNEEYFTIKAELEKTSLVAKDTTTVTVTAILTKAPISESVTAEVDVDLIAIPVEPGAEGSSGITNGSSQSPKSTLATLGISNNNIGAYIDLGNNIIGETETTDDWRIFYVDEESDKVYAILADYLPATKVPEAAGLTTDPTEYPYGAWSDQNRDVLLNGLKKETAWSNFTNGIVEATATGAPTAELFMSSYNAKNNTELVYTDFPTLDSSKADYDLYVPHTSIIEKSQGYWLSTPYTDYDHYLWYVSFGGKVFCDGQEGIDYYYLPYPEYSARPVVELPISTTAELIDGVWTILK